MTWWLRLPESWPVPLVAGIALLLLTVLDLTGSAVAKEAVERRSLPLAVAGAGLFLMMFWVYASSLAVADLVVVSVGWCVLVVVGVLALNRIRYGVHLSPLQYAAVALALIALTVLQVSPPAGRATNSTSPASAAQVPLTLAHPPEPAASFTATAPDHRGSVPVQQARRDVPKKVVTAGTPSGGPGAGVRS